MSNLEGSSKRRFRVGSHTIVRTVGDQRMILDSRSGSYAQLSDVADVVWSGVEAGLDESEIVDHISVEYGVERGVVMTDVHEFLDDVVARQLIIEIRAGDE